MPLSSARFAPLFAAIVLFVACGGAHGKAPATGGAATSDSASGDEASAPSSDAASGGGDSSGGGDGGGGGGSIESAHQGFLKTCVTDPALASYCECSWGVVLTVLTPKQLQSDVDAYTKQQLIGAIRKQCLGKYPESIAKAQFIGACAKAANEMTPYCNCRWAQLRKSFSVAELETPETTSTQKFIDLRKPIAKACSAKLSENSVADGFETGCNKGPGLGAFCKCAWKQVRARMSLGEVADPGSTDSPEFKAAMDDVGKKCQAFRPAE